MNREEQIKAIRFDTEEWEKLFCKYQQEYITHIPLVMEGEKQLGKRIREQIIALAGGRKEIQNMKAKRRQICNLSQVLKRN
jgi:hypothetical protein